MAGRGGGGGGGGGTELAADGALGSSIPAEVLTIPVDARRTVEMTPFMGSPLSSTTK